MPTAVEQRLDFRAASERVGATQKDAEWMRELRARAAQLATELDWPDSHAKRPWKYYDSTQIGLTPDGDLAGGGVSSSGGAGASVTRFSEATGAAAETIARFLGSGVRPETDRLTALHYAFLREGVFVQVPANVEVSEPVRLQRSITGSGLSTPHTLIVTGANSRVTIVEEYSSTDGMIVALPAAEILPGPGSEVRYYCVHRWGNQTKVFANQRFVGAERDAAFQNLHVVLGGEVVKGHLESSLSGRGTSSELLGLSYGADAQHVDFFTLQDHLGPDTRSDLLIKSALTDHARSVYYGLTRVGLGAHNADANQENRNILLSKTAKADSDPVLEILTNDIIRASHGATVGPVDEEQLFYLETRGIRRKDAEAMLVRAFLGQVLGRVKDEALREELEAALDVKLGAS